MFSLCFVVVAESLAVVLFDKKALKKLISSDMKRIKERQKKDGSFGVWTKFSDTEYAMGFFCVMFVECTFSVSDFFFSSPFISCHVAHTAAICKAQGFNISEGILRFVSSWTKKLGKYLEKLSMDPKYTKNYDKNVGETLRAYALVLFAFSFLFSLSPSRQLRAERKKRRKTKKNAMCHSYQLFFCIDSVCKAQDDP